MAKVKTITLTKNGEQVSFDKEPAAIFSSLANGRYTITIAPEKDPRSLDQNALMWLWFKCIEDETGTPSQDVHDYYCTKFLRKRVVWNCTERWIIRGTSKLKKDEMKDFLTKVQADALTEMGIRLPDREDMYYEAFYQTYK